MDAATCNAAIDATIKRYVLTFHYTHVPFLESRPWLRKLEEAKKVRNPNPQPRWRDLHVEFSVEVRRAGRALLTALYTDGHVSNGWVQKPGVFAKPSLLDFELAWQSVTTGYAREGKSYRLGTKRLRPSDRDVLASLVGDADVLNYSSFEEWASRTGFNTDSRKDEAYYRECLEIARALRNSIGDAGLAEFQQLYEGY